MGINALTSVPAHVQVLRNLGRNIDQWNPGGRSVNLDLLDKIAGRDPRIADLISTIRTLDGAALQMGSYGFRDMTDVRKSTALLQFARNVDLSPPPAALSRTPSPQTTLW